MTVPEINKARELSKRIRELERKVAALRVACDNIVPVIDGMPHSTEIKSKVERIALRIVEGDRELENLRGELEQEKTRIMHAIMSEYNEPIEQTLLVLRYVSCLSFSEVARRMHCGLRHVFRLHSRLLKNVI